MLCLTPGKKAAPVVVIMVIDEDASKASIGSGFTRNNGVLAKDAEDEEVDEQFVTITSSRGSVLM